jgi:hypothetical protein
VLGVRTLEGALLGHFLGFLDEVIYGLYDYVIKFTRLCFVQIFEFRLIRRFLLEIICSESNLILVEFIFRVSEQVLERFENVWEW